MVGNFFKKIKARTLRTALEVFEHARNYFITYSVRPKKASIINTWSTQHAVNAKTAIVIQGPLDTVDDFTLETVRLYRKHYPDSRLVLSTWEGEDASTLQKITGEGVFVITNKKPANRGPRNINLQIVSGSSGISKAKELGAEFVLKTRTDQRIYAPNALSFFHNLLETFPPTKGFSQKARIVASSFATLTYRLYGVTDMLMFGTTDDMELYWNPPLDSRTISPSDSLTLGEFSKASICETYLASQFLEKIGRRQAWTLSDSLAAYGEHFVIFDYQTIDLYWHKEGTYWGKYDRHNEQRFMDYEEIYNNRLLSFADWLSLYTHGPTSLDVSEKTLDFASGAKVVTLEKK